MELNEYQDEAIGFAAYPKEARLLYPSFALVEEVGEFNGKIAKMIRKDASGERAQVLSLGYFPLSLEEEQALRKEAGDILWQFSALMHGFGWTLEEIAQENLDKLQARKQAGTIIGEGDQR
jgi:NTP pyrophosphatase (non-canonical NTP hydrolase)